LFDVFQSAKVFFFFLFRTNRILFFYFIFRQLRRSRSFCFTGYRKQKATFEGSRPAAGGRFRRIVEKKLKIGFTQKKTFFYYCSRSPKEFSEKKQYEEEEEE
jgi:hypothetical protein